MNPTNQHFVFDTQAIYLIAIAALATLPTTSYKVVASNADERMLHVWFADVQTGLLPWCKVVFPEPEEGSDPE